MNEGRDVSALAPLLQQLAFPPTRTEPVEALRRQALDAETGEPLWSRRLGDQMLESPEGPPRLLWWLPAGGVMYESLPAVSGDLGYFVSNDGWLL